MNGVEVDVAVSLRRAWKGTKIFYARVVVTELWKTTIEP
jgi:hypothetical protein